MIEKNLDEIREQVAISAKKAGREPEEIKLVAVSKRFPVEKMLEVLDAKQYLFGENYIQETREKRPLLPSDAKIHFIGHLQSNKAKIAAETCDMIETIDRIKLGRILNNHLESLGKTMRVLIQVNIGQDTRKSGVAPEKAEELIVQLQELSNIKVCGLMTMPPFEKDPEFSRPYFTKLRQLSEELTTKGLLSTPQKPELSMGMSNDFRIAIEEGATIIRVGTAIFGQRPPR